jgi:hypothetical protein
LFARLANVLLVRNVRIVLVVAKSKDTNAKHKHVARKIMANITDRSGFDIEIDDDILEEIIDELVEILYGEYGDFDRE